MRTVADMSREQLEQTLASEIATARADLRPISRMALSRVLMNKHALTLHDAERFVDLYCDEKEPAIPTLLSNEFGVPYLRVIGILNALLALGFLIITLRFQRPTLPVWPGLLLATLFAVSAIYLLAKSLKPPTEKARPVRLEDDLPTINIAEPSSTAPLQPRS